MPKRFMSHEYRYSGNLKKWQNNKMNKEMQKNSASFVLSFQVKFLKWSYFKFIVSCNCYASTIFVANKDSLLNEFELWSYIFISTLLWFVLFSLTVFFWYRLKLYKILRFYFIANGHKCMCIYGCVYTVSVFAWVSNYQWGNVLHVSMSTLNLCLFYHFGISVPHPVGLFKTVLVLFRSNWLHFY